MVSYADVIANGVGNIASYLWLCDSWMARFFTYVSSIFKPLSLHQRHYLTTFGFPVGALPGDTVAAAAGFSFPDTASFCRANNGLCGYIAAGEVPLLP